MAFRGEHAHAIDAKGRTSLPAKFREVLQAAKESSLIITLDPYAACLTAYPLPEWQRFEQRLERRKESHPEQADAVLHLKQVVVARAHEVEIDGMGRVLIPPTLRDYAHLDKEVVWVGQVQTIQLWSQDRWQKAQAIAQKKILEAPVAAALRSLL